MMIRMILMMMVSLAPQAAPVIYIYADAGADAASVAHTRLSLGRSLPGAQIRDILAIDVIQGAWTQDAWLFVMPGGADLPYCEKLAGAGNAIIGEYVFRGGRYLGICAGAYYGSYMVDFDPGGPLHVWGFRELAFFPGAAHGPILAPYVYGSHTGARVAWLEDATSFFSYPRLPVFYNGGCCFENASFFPNTQVLYNYTELAGPKAAVIKTFYGAGAAVLSGVHPEYDPILLAESLAHQGPGWENLEAIHATLAADTSAAKVWQRMLTELELSPQKPPQTSVGPRTLPA